MLGISASLKAFISLNFLNSCWYIHTVGLVAKGYQYADKSGYYIIVVTSYS